MTTEDQQPQTTPPPATPPADDAAAGLAPPEQRSMGMLCHLLALSGFVIPFGSLLGPLLIWLIKKDEMPFVDDQGKESLNFQITVFLAMFASAMLMFVLIGFLLLPIVVVAAVVMVIIAALKANEGEYYRYPFCLRLVT